MDKQFLCLDSPTDFMVGKYISADELKEFINIPCKIKAGVFILCMEGQIRSTINMSELTTSKLNVVTLLPNSRIQIHEISPDILIYFIAFSFDFMCYANLKYKKGRLIGFNLDGESLAKNLNDERFNKIEILITGIDDKSAANKGV